ncbi:MAG: hypothetical protein M3Y53_01325 [Thermoproteota archaeon]|nr:hypothetical protein [Thermoproteota archaeon]
MKKARILTDRQSQTSISASELDEPNEQSKLKDYDHQHNFDTTCPSFQLPSPNTPQTPSANDIMLQTQGRGL